MSDATRVQEEIKKVWALIFRSGYAGEETESLYCCYSNKERAEKAAAVGNHEMTYSGYFFVEEVNIEE